MVQQQVLADYTGEQGHFEALKRKKAALANLLGITVQGALVLFPEWLTNRCSIPVLLQSTEEDDQKKNIPLSTC